MVADDDVREKIMQRAGSSVIEKVAVQNGLRLLREDGWMKVRAGITTPDEVIRSTKV
jgi:type II secretory ATPase GspE/PulE/Tfp pilus assembly ATPase PilB-like protein